MRWQLLLVIWVRSLLRINYELHTLTLLAKYGGQVSQSGAKAANNFGKVFKNELRL